MLLRALLSSLRADRATVGSCSTKSERGRLARMDSAIEREKERHQDACTIPV